MFAIYSVEGARAYLTVSLNIQEKRSALRLKPSSLRDAVLRGSLKTWSFEISNVGLATAANVFVSLPKGAGFVLISSGQSMLLAGNATKIVVGFTRPSTATLGRHSGTFRVRYEATCTQFVRCVYMF